MNNPKVFEMGLCSECGKKIVSRWCDYIVHYERVTIFMRNYEAAKANSELHYETCDLPLCDDCIHEVGKDIGFCSHHHSQHLNNQLPTKKLRDRQLKEQLKILSSAMIQTHTNNVKGE